MWEKKFTKKSKGSGKLSNSILYQSLILYKCNNKWATSLNEERKPMSKNILSKNENEN